MQSNKKTKLTRDEANEILINFVSKKMEISEDIVDSAVSEFCQKWKLSSDCQSDLFELCVMQMIAFSSLCVFQVLENGMKAEQSRKTTRLLI